MMAVRTMLGIVICVAAVVAMVAGGEGGRSSVEEKIRSLGTNLVVVLPGTTTSGGVRAGSGSNSRLTVQDAQGIGRDDPAVTMVAYFIQQAAQVVSGDRNWSTLVVGTTPNYFAVRDWPLTAGRPFTEDEQRSAATVCLLGQTVVTNLFGDSLDPLGAVIRVKNVAFHVIGVLAPKGQSNTGHDQDDLIVIPFETAERKVLGTAEPSAQALTSTQMQLDSYVGRPNALGTSAKIKGKINAIYAKASGADSIDSAIDQLTRTLRSRHHIVAGKDDDFTVRNLADIARASADASQVMTILLAAVSSVPPLVGGIRRMNVRLLPVNER